MIETKHLESLGQLAECARFAQERLGDLLWFRGQSDATWQLLPTVYRGYQPLREHQMFQRFRWQAPLRRSSCPPQERGDQWLPLMRHHGLPVRLLDWTESILIAVFFALCFEKKSGPAAVWVLSPLRMNQHYAGRETLFALSNKEPVLELVLGLFDPAVESDKVLAVLAPETDHRMATQQSAYTIHGLKSPLEDVRGAENWLMKFLVPEDARAEFDADLRIVGMRQSALFPDLEHLSQDLREGHLL